MRVLVAEDFEVLARAIATGLRREGMAVDVALGGDNALESLAVTRYHVVVLDGDLPGTHGDEVSRQIVAGGLGSRVLMLTAASTVADRVNGLGLGADDYLPKPFDFAELVAGSGRCPAAVGRGAAGAHGGDLTVDRHAGWRSGPGAGSISARRSSPSSNACSRRAAGSCPPRSCWSGSGTPEADPFTTAVKTTIRRLRLKLGDPPVIHTVREGGYRAARS